MSIEKPISTIRKAIKGAAETEAEQEGLEYPKDRHFKEAFSFYRFLKMSDPKMYEDSLLSAAKGMDLKKEMGETLYKLFTQVLEKITSKNGLEIERELKQMKKSNQFSQEELKKWILELNKKLIKLNDMELRKDLRLISAFSRKEELLKRTIDFISSSILNSIESM